MRQSMSKGRVKKALILAAGWGTRFLPITKVIPKELIPIGNKPTLHYLIEECANSGIEEVCIVIREWGSLTERYFERDIALESLLERFGKSHIIPEINNPTMGLRIHFVKQLPVPDPYPMGHGTPVLSAANWIGDDNFALMFCDDLVKAPVPGLQQLKDAWDANPDLTGGIVMTAEVSDDELAALSSVEYGEDCNAGVRRLKDYIEKPKKGQARFTNDSMFGRAVYSAKIIDYLKENLQTTKDNQGEFSTWDAMMSMNKDMPVGCLTLEGTWVTTGKPDQLRAAEKVMLDL